MKQFRPKRWPYRIARSSHSCVFISHRNELNVMGIAPLLDKSNRNFQEFNRSKQGAIKSNFHRMKFTSHKKELRKCPTTLRTPRKPPGNIIRSLAGVWIIDYDTVLWCDLPCFALELIFFFHSTWWLMLQRSWTFLKPLQYLYDFFK